MTQGVDGIVFTGRGSSGSWQIRGLQLARALGCRSIPNMLHPEEARAVVLVKRPRTDLLARIHAANVPLIWDLVDPWPQPAGNLWEREECMQWLRSEVARVQPAAMVAATQAMARDLAEFGVPVLVLPHHANPELARNPIREHVRVVGYEGGHQYLGRWERVALDACEARGLHFVATAPQWSHLDIVLAVREQRGYAARNWKSNVKLANAQGTGTPVILCREAGYEETASGAEVWVEEESDLGPALDSLMSQDVRAQASAKLLEAAPRLEDVAKVYAEWLTALSF